MSSYIETFNNKLDWAMPFQRTGKFPIDRSSIFHSYEDALKYAKGQNDSRNLSGTSYVGQLIVVYENDSVSLYIIKEINNIRELEKVGSDADIRNIVSELSQLSQSLEQHSSNTNNPHNVTKQQLGLENVNNTSDVNKPISSATQSALNTKYGGVSVSNTNSTVDLTYTNSQSGGTALKQISIPSATVSKAGVMSSQDKIYINNYSKRIIDLGNFNSVDEAFAAAAESSIVNSEAQILHWTSNNFAGIIMQSRNGNNYVIQYSFFYGTLGKQMYRLLTRGTSISVGEWKNLILPLSITYNIDTRSIIFQEAETSTSIELPLVTTTKPGLMSAADKSKLDAFKNSSSYVLNSEKGSANGIATLNANGQIPSSQLPSFVDDIIDVYATYNTSNTGQLSNIKLYSNSAHTSLVTGESGKIYQNIESGKPAYQFRWTGSVFSQVGATSLILGEISGTAYDGAKGAKNTSDIATINSNISTIQTTLNNKANASHTHPISNITNLQTTLNGKANTNHGHVISDITDLQTTLNNKAAFNHNHSGVYQPVGNYATKSELTTGLSTKAESSHTHSAANLTDVTIQPGVVLGTDPNSVNIHLYNKVNIDNSEIENTIIKNQFISHCNVGIGTIQSSMFDVNIGTNVTIGSNIGIGKNVSIGDSVQIDSYSFIGDWVNIGARSYIGQDVTISDGLIINSSNLISSTDKSKLDQIAIYSGDLHLHNGDLRLELGTGLTIYNTTLNANNSMFKVTDLNTGTIIETGKDIKIGDNTLISPRVRLGTGIELYYSDMDGGIILHCDMGTIVLPVQ